ncbi:MAG: hypothetical protein EB830_01180 [Nitrosopumilus sp. H13]|nr:MAG: hypothetical protein EB830_01180 [Nitrosopumilus sp. H13]
MPKSRPEKFKKRDSTPIEQRIGTFVQRNSRNGYFTKVGTIQQKFRISEERTWEIVGMLLSDGTLESTHDRNTGEMKLCEMDHTRKIIGQTRKRKRGGDENLPSQCHPPGSRTQEPRSGQDKIGKY